MTPHVQLVAEIHQQQWNFRIIQPVNRERRQPHLLRSRRIRRHQRAAFIERARVRLAAPIAHAFVVPRVFDIQQLPNRIERNARGPFAPDQFVLNQGEPQYRVLIRRPCNRERLEQESCPVGALPQHFPVPAANSLLLEARVGAKLRGPLLGNQPSQEPLAQFQPRDHRIELRLVQRRRSVAHWCLPQIFDRFFQMQPLIIH
jgi:hypothetical protein